MSTTTITADVTDPALAESTAPTEGKFAWIRGFSSFKIVLGLSIFAFFLLVAIFGPLIVTGSPLSTSSDTIQPPSPQHWLGTTHTGQDVFTQMVYGTRTSMVVGLGAAILSILLSLIIGISAGYLGGLWDDVLSVLANIFLVIPGLPLVILLAGYLPDAGSAGIIAVIALTSWAWGARVLRAQTLSLRKRDFIEASRATGESTWRIIFAEVLPNQVAVIASLFLSTTIGAILTQAGLAFLGLSDVTEYSWGGILYWAQNSAALLFGAWWWFVPAGLAIALVGMALSLVNFGIDEFINPRLRAAGIATRRRRRKVAKRVVPKTTAPRRTKGATSGAAFTSGDVVLEIRDLSVDYVTGSSPIHAVNNVNLTLRRGEVLGVAGESGSGKSTLAYAITRLHRPPAEITSGSLLYTGRDGTQVDILDLNERDLTDFRWEELSIAFQSAMNALNPLLTVGTQIEDVIQAHRPDMDKAARHARVLELLGLVGIQQDRVGAYPHELSGGMRQRAMIAIALALDPEIIVMDEPTTALDVVIQRQIVEQIMELKDRLGFAVVFITHDLSLLIELSDHIAIMYAGKVVEVGAAEDFYRQPKHPYSQGLLGSFPNLTGPKRQLTGIPGSPPDLRALPTGCPFRTRCPKAFDACAEIEPPLFEVADLLKGAPPREPSRVACLLYDEALVGAGAKA